MKKYLLSFIAACICGGVYSQSFMYGVKAGVNVSDFSNVTGVSGRVGWNVGLRGEYRFHGETGLYGSVGLDVKKVGYKTASIVTFDKQESAQEGQKEGAFHHSVVNSHYFQLPVHVGYRVSLGKNVKLFGEAGPYVAQYFTERCQNYVNHKKAGSSKKDVGIGFPHFDCGVGGNLGVDLFKHVQFSLGYEYGLREKSDLIRNKGFNAQVAYMF